MNRLKNIIFCILCIISVSCKKSLDTGPQDVSKPVAKPRGATMGVSVNKVIGSEGGTVQSGDGIFRMIIPAGAVSANTNFSIQQVENTLGSNFPSFRLLPENIAFSKDITIEYDYSKLGIHTSRLKLLFFAYQDSTGVYHDAGNLKNRAAETKLVVTTRHFSDWTIYTKYDLNPVGKTLKNGIMYLRESEKATFQLKYAMIAGNPAKPDIMDVALSSNTNVIIASAKWELHPLNATMTIDYTAGNATVRAPASFENGETGTMLSVTLAGDLGKDNEGNVMKQVIIFQEIVYESDEFFEASVAGANFSRVKDYVVEPQGGIGIVIGGYLGATSFTIQTTLTGSGNQGFGDISKKGFAQANILTPGEVGYLSMRPKDCNTGGLVYSDGSVIITHYATKQNDYTEGSFSATLFNIGWCNQATTRSISGRFRIRKK